MNLAKQLEKELSKNNAQAIAQFIKGDPEKFAELMAHFFGKEYRITQRAAHAMSHCVDLNKELLIPYIGRLINNLKSDPNVAIKRNTVRLLQCQEIPVQYQGLLVEKCFSYLLSTKETIAVRVFSMTILHNMVLQYPEMKNELVLVIKDVIKNGSSGFINRGKKILQAIDN
jgi:hypothetical protein